MRRLWGTFGIKKVTMPPEFPQIEASELQRQIMAGLTSYTKRSSFECFALLMGKAQILEFGLKNLLVRLC